MSGLPDVTVRRLGALLFTASEAAQLAGNEVLQPLGLGVRHFGVLTFLIHELEGPGRDDDAVHTTIAGRPAGGLPLSQQAIGEALRIDRSTMVALIDELERAGHVRRERNPVDRRAYVIRVTDAGAALQRRAEDALNARAGEFFAPLSPEEQRRLREALVKLIERA